MSYLKKIQGTLYHRFDLYFPERLCERKGLAFHTDRY